MSESAKTKKIALYCRKSAIFLRFTPRQPVIGNFINLLFTYNKLVI